MPLLPRVLLTFPLVALTLTAAPLSQQTRIDFFRDVPSRNLQGLATRSDGRITAGPVLRELSGEVGAELLWSIVPGPDHTWLVGTGPQGSIRKLTTDLAGQTVTSTEWARVDDAQVYALQRLPDGSVLAGSSPRGGLHLLRDGAVIASARLPVDSVFDLLLSTDQQHAFVGTGNPGRVYRVHLPTFAASGTDMEITRDAAALAARGIERFGDIRDRNVRRLARATDGRILAGSSPAGKLYAFPADGGAPELLLDHTRAEITDLRVEPNGDVFALVVHSSTPGQQMRVIRTAPTPAGAPPDAAATAAPVPEEELSDVPAVERFSGRSALVWLPGGNGFPETLASRANIALYRLAARGDVLLMSGGDAGEIVGFDRIQRRSLTFGGSTSAQLSDLVPLGPDRYLVLRNNPAGLAVLDFTANTPRRAETRRIDLRTPGTLGALRFNRLRAVEPAQLQLSLRANRADDEAEGWTPWRSARESDGGWHVPELRGRFAQVRIELPANIDSGLEIDAASLHFLPQNRRPVLQAFRVISPNFGLLPRTDNPTAPILTLGQVIGQAPEGPAGGDKRASLLGSQLVPQPGAQVVYWTLEDPDGDELAATFSIRREGTEDWIDLAVDSTEPWVQFDRSHLPDGVYFTRLRVREQAPRAAAERLESIMQTDDLVIDQTPPLIEHAAIERRGGALVVTVAGRDATSLLAGIELVFNNGYKAAVEQPADGILDSRVETFVAEVRGSDASAATNVEILLYDAIGNSTSRRLPLP